MTTKMFNTRIGEDLDDAIGDAAEREGLSKSAWAREVLGAAAVGGVSLEALKRLAKESGRDDDVQVQPDRIVTNTKPVPGLRLIDRRACVHPEQGIRTYPFMDVCGVCGKVVKRR